ncbi:Aldehyde dehydrogenase domain-containing protein [Plasmodiophora brassicae]
MTVLQCLNLVDGRFVAAADGGTLDDFNPATGERIAVLPRSRAADVDAAVSAAERAFPQWSETPVEDRARCLERIADAVEARLDDFAELESMDTGKPVQLARTVDIPRAVANLRFFAQAVRQQEAPSTEMTGAINYTQRMPVGVAALITPWNLPIYLLTWKLAPALAMGCTVVCKPSELSPLTAHALANIIVNVGLPPGVANFVFGLGSEAGEPLIRSPSVDAVSFTGGTVTGRTVAVAASETFKKLSLELGGKNATIVFADCNFDQMIEGVLRSSFLNSGQICLCGSRILVERPLLDKFLDAFVKRTKSLTVGDPKTSWMGSVISPQQLKKVEYYVKLAAEEGGKILCGGERPGSLLPPFSNGCFFEPTVIVGLSTQSRCATEEIFGPVVTVHPFDTEDEAVQIHNSVRYGLAGSVWTSNLGRAHRVTRRMHTGMVWVNTWLKRDLRVPFGGIKESGIGKEGGMRSLEFFSEMKNICIQYEE